MSEAASLDRGTLAVDPGIQYTREFIEETLPRSVHTLLEIGCGDGALAAVLQSAGLKVVGLEADYRVVRLARANGIATIWADWPSALGAQFDAILFTRSLHHLAELGLSIETAWHSLRQGGSLIAEETLIGGEDESSLEWFRGTVRKLKTEKAMTRSSAFLEAIASGKKDLGTLWRDLHGSERHSTSRMSETILSRFGQLEVTKCAYLFRYLIPFLPHSKSGEVLEEECRMIDEGHIQAFGRRFVAKRRQKGC